MKPWSILGLVAPLVLGLGPGAGCRDDAPSMADPGTSTSAGSDSSDTGAVDTTAGNESSGTGSDTGEPEPEPVPDPPPVAPFSEPELVEIDGWIAAQVDDPDDVIGEAIDAGTFTLPAEGEAYGVTWETIVPGDNGELTSVSADSMYAAAEITVPTGHRLLARDDTVRAMFSDNAHRQPGDIYASGGIRVPLAAREDGPTLVVARTYGRRGVPEVQLWSTPDELVFNLSDLTVPDYAVGDDSTQYVGVPILNLVDRDTRHLRAHVIENEYFEDTVIEYPGIAAVSLTQIAFELRPKAPLGADDVEVPAVLRIEPLWFEASYEREVMVQVRDPDAVLRRTRRSQVDGSVQYYAVRRPSGFSPGADYGLVLSLHGAGVQASGQAASYSPKDWAYIIAPTNRRPFGFDWEEWGRLDAIEALDHAEDFFLTDPLRVHLTGHSMGGHGTWHVGVHFPGRFGVIAPSAGWISFDTYGSLLIPDGVVGAARAASKTMDFVTNFAASPTYIIHGLADTNVPPFQAQTMYDTLGPIAPELWYHAEPGAGHWWDLDPTEPGADCVDWEPMIDIMSDRGANPRPLDFHFVSAGPWVSPQRSYVRILSTQTPLAHAELDSVRRGDALTLTTTNVRSMRVDTSIPLALGVRSLSVDGEAVALDGGVVTIGPSTGKNPEVHGPLNQVFHRPVVFVYPDDGPPAFRDYAAYLSGAWSVIGNGQARAVAWSQRPEGIEADYNLVYVGIAPERLEDLPEAMAFEVAGDAVTFGGQEFAEAALAFVYPAASGRLSAVFTTAPGFEHLLFRYVPFSSRSGVPDYYIWRASNANRIGGFFDAEWNLDPDLAEVF